MYDFAGESVEVSKVVDAESKEGQKFLKSQNPEEDHQPAEKGQAFSPLQNCHKNGPQVPDTMINPQKSRHSAFVILQGQKH